MPSASAAAVARRRRRLSGPMAAVEFTGGGEAADISDLFEGLFSGMAGAAAAAADRSAVRRRSAAARRRRRHKLDVPFEDAARMQGQRHLLAGGKTLDIKLPAGVDDGTKIRLRDKASPACGQWRRFGHDRGQAAPLFRREGDNIRLDLPVSIDEAVLGGKVGVPTVDGPVMLSVPKGRARARCCAKGKGFTGKKGQRGDQLVTLMVDVPDDADLARFLEGWGGKGKANPRAGLGV